MRGGSTLGYKRAGFDVIGNVEIDPRINDIYITNNKPKYNYCEDLRIFNQRDDLPEELYQLDILDGSPPCTSFSTAGVRERDWGKAKKFKEGQKVQTLDDDRGCYNCKYRIIQRQKDKDWCEVHGCEVGIWQWCEGWEYS